EAGASRSWASPNRDWLPPVLCSPAAPRYAPGTTTRRRASTLPASLRCWIRPRRTGAALPRWCCRRGFRTAFRSRTRPLPAGEKPGGAAIIGVDDEICRDVCGELRRSHPARIIPISVREEAAGGVYVDSGWLVDAMDGPPKRVLELASAERLPGSHNWQNAAAAYAAARAAGIATEAASAAIRSFPGLAHRQELVDTIDTVRYISDSKATNADATEKALACYSDIYWIAGG